jgi:hypothetical protein
MDNVTFIEIEYPIGVFTEYAIIDNGDGSFTSITKLDYDEMLAKLNEVTND